LRVFVIEALELVWLVDLPDGVPCETIPNSPEWLQFLLEELSDRALTMPVGGQRTSRRQPSERIRWTRFANR